MVWGCSSGIRTVGGGGNGGTVEPEPEPELEPVPVGGGAGLNQTSSKRLHGGHVAKSPTLVGPLGVLADETQGRAPPINMVDEHQPAPALARTSGGAVSPRGEPRG